MATVVSQRSASWRVLARVTSTRSTTWHVSARVTSTRSTAWKYQAPIPASSTSSMNVGLTMVPVTFGSATPSSMRMILSASVGQVEVKS